MSVFVAVWPDPHVRDGLADATARILTDDRGRLVAPDRYHLTLAFLGDIGPTHLDRLVASLDPIETEPFAIAVARTGWFARARVGWLGPMATQPLSDLRDAVVRACRAAGTAPDDARFVPHVTVVRDRRVPLPNWTGPEVVWPVSGFALCQSDDGHYSVLAHHPFHHAP